MNSVFLIGRLTKDVELKVTQSNISVASFNLAVDRQYKDESGESQADFISCVVWRNQAENLVKYCGKGSLIAVSGRLQTRQYDTDNGTKYVTEVVADNIQFLDTKKEEKQEDKPKSNAQGVFKAEDVPLSEPEEGLPF